MLEITPLKKLEPRLIQRCFIGEQNDLLMYKYMGSKEFEKGGQERSIKRMLRNGVVLATHPVNISNEEIIVFLIPSSGFDFGAYFEVLKGLINKEWELEKPLYFEDSLQQRGFQTNAWFDFTNDVFFTFGKEWAISIINFLKNAESKFKDIS